MYKVSVITTIFKTERFLSKCLNSLLAQSLPEIEFVWVDNGASDECKQIIQNYKEDNIKVVRLNSNQGYVGGIKAGLKVATGEYIGFCDSDDWLDPTYYEQLYSLIVKNNADVAICPYTIENTDGSSKKEDLNFYGVTSDVFSLFKSISCGSIWNCLFKRNLLSVDFIDEKNKKSIFMDNLFLISALINSKKAVLTNAVSYHYFQRDDSTIRHMSRMTVLNASKYIVSSLEPLFFEKNDLKTLYAVVNFLQRSIPIYLIDKNYLSNSLIFKQFCEKTYFNKYIYKFYFPSFKDRLFSLSINNEKSRIKLRMLGITKTFKVC